MVRPMSTALRVGLALLALSARSLLAMVASIAILAAMALRPRRPSDRTALLTVAALVAVTLAEARRPAPNLGQRLRVRLVANDFAQRARLACPYL